MECSAITLDTHSLIWYVDELSKKRLSLTALQAIREAERNATIYVPAIAMMELLDLVDRGRISLSFDSILSFIEESENYEIVPLDVDLLKVAIPLKGLEMHDRLILATAILTNSVLVSKDRDISARGVGIVW